MPWKIRIPRFDRGNSTIIIPALILLWLTLVPLVFLVYGSFRSGRPGDPEAVFTLGNYLQAFGTRVGWVVLKDTLIFAIGSTLWAVFLAVAFAWVVERTNMPLKNLVFAFVVAPMAIPGMLSVIGWLLLTMGTGPYNALLKLLFGEGRLLINLRTMGGMIWVQGVDSVPTLFLLMAAAFRSMEPSLEEASRICGSGNFTTLKNITLPVLRPALLAITLWAFVKGIEGFEIPALLGLPMGIKLYSTIIYEATSTTPQNLNLASTYSVGYMAATAVGLYLYLKATQRSEQFAVVTGKGYRSRVIDLGKAKYVFSVVFVLAALFLFIFPPLILTWTSFLPYMAPVKLSMLKKFTLQNYQYILSYPSIARSFVNSTILAISSGFVVVALTTVAAWIVVRTKIPGRRLLDALATFPMALPGLVLGVSLLWTYLSLPFSIYGTLIILLIAYSTKYLPFSMRTMYASLSQVNRELEDASAVCGASFLQTVMGVLLPVMMPGAVSAWIYVMIHGFREVSASLLLYTSGTEVVPVMIWDLFANSRYTHVGAMATLMMLILLILTLVARVIGSRMGIKTS